MKILIVFLTIVLSVTVSNAQTYEITFSASGAASTLDSVKVVNQTQGTQLTLLGNDTLLLVDNTGLSDITTRENEFMVYPNPSNGIVYADLQIYQHQKVIIDILDISGRKVVGKTMYCTPGEYTIQIAGLGKGLFVCNIKTNRWEKSARFISFATEGSSPAISVSNTSPASTKEMRLISQIQMGFMPGDSLQFTGYSGTFNKMMTLSPTLSQTIDFNFPAPPCPATFTDARDSNTYIAIQFGNQCWMAENLAYLPSVVGSITGSDTTPYYYAYGYQSTSVTAAKSEPNYTIYGVLYNWPAAMNGSSSSSSNPSGVQGVCPAGWHLPSDDEWKELEMHLGMSQTEANSTGWRGTDQGSQLAGNASLWGSGSLTSNSAFGTSGFTALPGGYRSNGGYFNNIRLSGTWWSSTEYSSSYACYRTLLYSYTEVGRGSDYKENGFSVRCVRD
jgi:uncharacterized protein (TIGR02145 family)